ncbi:hypothetical protein BN990_00914 [Virgibacillus salexigens]|uniref:Fur family transcriptional regulator n=1 Tax=Virgibacillus massiliensis TaxID=1462526 RepID=A0A024Q8N6_9BACI|nr:hypothetical protein BN990_00914 [Virgibacillus massiliensis]
MNMINDRLKDYQIHSHKFEIYGLCPQCTSPVKETGIKL